MLELGYFYKLIYFVLLSIFIMNRYRREKSVC